MMMFVWFVVVVVAGILVQVRIWVLCVLKTVSLISIRAVFLVTVCLKLVSTFTDRFVSLPCLVSVCSRWKRWIGLLVLGGTYTVFVSGSFTWWYLVMKVLVRLGRMFVPRGLVLAPIRMNSVGSVLALLLIRVRWWVRDGWLRSRTVLKILVVRCVPPDRRGLTTRSVMLGRCVC